MTQTISISLLQRLSQQVVGQSLLSLLYQGSSFLSDTFKIYQMDTWLLSVILDIQMMRSHMKQSSTLTSLRNHDQKGLTGFFYLTTMSVISAFNFWNTASKTILFHLG